MANFFTDNIGTIAGVGLGLLGQRSSEKAAEQAAQAQLATGHTSCRGCTVYPTQSLLALVVASLTLMHRQQDTN